MWETLYHGTTCAVRDDRTWDGAWDWSDNTYSDGRQVMAQVRVNNWQKLDCNWPYNEFLCGDGPIQEHPRGSLCQIAPVIDPEDEGDHFKYHPPVQIDLEESDRTARAACPSSLGGRLRPRGGARGRHARVVQRTGEHRGAVVIPYHTADCE